MDNLNRLCCVVNPAQCEGCDIYLDNCEEHLINNRCVYHHMLLEQYLEEEAQEERRRYDQYRWRQDNPDSVS